MSEENDPKTESRIAKILEMAQPMSEAIVKAMDSIPGDDLDIDHAAAAILVHGAELEFYHQLFLKMGGNPAALAQFMGMAKARGAQGFVSFMEEIQGDVRVEALKGTVPEKN